MTYLLLLIGLLYISIRVSDSKNVSLIELFPQTFNFFFRFWKKKCLGHLPLNYQYNRHQCKWFQIWHNFNNFLLKYSIYYSIPCFITKWTRIWMTQIFRGFFLLFYRIFLKEYSLYILLIKNGNYRHFFYLRNIFFICKFFFEIYFMYSYNNIVTMILK